MRLYSSDTIFCEKQQKSASKTLLTTPCVLEAIFSRFCLDLGPPGDPFGTSWGLLGVPWGLLGAFWARLVNSWGPLGLNLGPLGRLFGLTWGRLGDFGTELGPPTWTSSALGPPI